VTLSHDDIAEHFGADPMDDDEAWDASYNVAPSQQVPVVGWRPGADRPSVRTLRWGLVPHWAKDLKIGNRMTNARVETLDEKNAFKGPLARHRCLVVFDGFYEWESRDDGKQPYYVHPADGAPLGMAGLYSLWRGPEGVVPTVAIVTTAAHGALAEIHHRCPVVVPAADAHTWLDPNPRDASAMRDWLLALPEPDLALHPVSRDASNVRNNRPDLIEPIELGDFALQPG